MYLGKRIIKMEIKKYNSDKEVINAYFDCKSKKSAMEETRTSFSFREYNDKGKTMVLHIFNKNRCT